MDKLFQAHRSKLQGPSKTDRGGVDGESPLGHYIVVYDPLEKRIYKNPESVQGSSDMMIAEIEHPVVQKGSPLGWKRAPWFTSSNHYNS